jgi:mycothiol synthase
VSTESASIVVRGLDPERDFPAVAELLGVVNDADALDWYPSAAALKVEWRPTAGFDPEADVRLLEQDGRLIGATKVDWRERAGKVTHRIETWVHPDNRRRGLGTELLAWSEERTRRRLAAGAGGSTELPHLFSAVLYDKSPSGVGFASAAGYVPVRYTFEMQRSLDDPVPDAPLPAGIDVRPVREDDLRAIWDADTEAFKDHWEASVRLEEDFTAFVSHPDVDTSMWQVAWDGDQVAGSVVNMIPAEENAQTGIDLGWLDHVSVRRPWRGRGLAAALIARSLHVLRERGMTMAALGVDAGNPTGALGLYERLGFRPVRTFVTYRKPV